MSQYLQEAFKAFTLLEGEEFDLTDSGVEDMKIFMDDEDKIDFTDVIDPEAETEEDLKDSYIGKIILDCKVCHSKIYKNADEVHINDELDEPVANEGDECPFCYSVDGFDIVGQVAPYQETEVKIDVEPKDNDEEDEEEVEVDETEIEESCGKKKKAIKESLEDITKEQIVDWLSEHDQAFDDAKSHFKKSNLNKVDKDDILDWISEHYTLTSDFENFFNCSIDESLNEGVSDINKKEIFNYLNTHLINNVKVDDIDIDNNEGYESFTIYLTPEKYNNDGYGYECTYIPGEITAEDFLDRTVDSLNKFIKEDSLKEGLENLDIETEHDKIHVEAEEKEPTGEEVIAPIEPEQEETILDNSEEETEEPMDLEGEPEEENEDEDEVDLDFNEFDEDSFNTMGESYLKRVYENVDSFKASKVRAEGNSLIVEGVISFNSGKKKSTAFKFEAKDVDRQGRLRFIGENLQITRGKKSFTLKGTLNEGMLTPSSLKYNYRVNGNRVYGTVKK